MCRPSSGIFPNLHVFPGGHLEQNDLDISASKYEKFFICFILNFRIDALKICAVRETLEESGVWPFPSQIKTFDYDKNNFNNFIQTNKISLKSIFDSKIYPWINWRTPVCKKIYPQKWDMQMFVAILDECSIDSNFKGDESEEIIWIHIKDALDRVNSDNMYLAPPQWFMLKEMEKYESDAEFVDAVQSGKYPKFFQPTLVGSENSNIWHSILYNDRFHNNSKASIYNVSQDEGPFHRIIMERFEGHFQKFKLIEQLVRDLL